MFKYIPRPSNKTNKCVFHPGSQDFLYFLPKKWILPHFSEESIWSSDICAGGGQHYPVPLSRLVLWRKWNMLLGSRGWWWMAMSGCEWTLTLFFFSCILGGSNKWWRFLGLFLGLDFCSVLEKKHIGPFEIHWAEVTGFRTPPAWRRKWKKA